MIRVLLIALMLAGAATAQERVPALFDVHGVIAPDTLNIRGGPGSEFPDIGDLEANAIYIEVVSLDEGGNWGVIRWEGGEGWVSMRYLRKRVPNLIEGHEIEANFACAGTEPFWSLWFHKDGSVVFDDYNELQSEHRLLWSGMAVNRSYAPLGFVVENERGQMMGVLHQEYCSDGMSDLPFGYRVDMILNNSDGPMMLSGCCALSMD